MKFEKLFKVSLDIENPIELYMDIETSLLNILRNNYERRCIRECFIDKINRLVKYSDCFIDAEDSSSRGRIDLQFIADVIVYPSNEILNGCLIVKKDRDSIVCHHKNAYIMITDNQIQIASVPINSIISVQVEHSAYIIGGNKATINGIPYLGEAPAVIVEINKDIQINGELHKAELEQAKYFEDLYNEKYKAEKISTFFAEVLQLNSKAETKGVSLYDIASGKVQLKEGQKLQRDINVKLTQPICTFTEGKSTNEIMNADNALTIMLRNYINHIETLCDYSRIYDTEKIRKDHSNLWKSFGNIKKKYNARRV